MFSRPILAGGLIASASAVSTHGFIAKPTANLGGTDYSIGTSCASCISGFLDGKWYYQKTAAVPYKSYATKTAVSISGTDVLGQGICCKD